MDLNCLGCKFKIRGLIIYIMGTVVGEKYLGAVMFKGCLYMRK
jgi:hypothetical protein